MPLQLPDLQDIEAAAEVVYRSFQATPQYRWGTLSQRLGTDCWVKHENHTPVGAFKIRGGLTYFDQLQQRGEMPREVFSATRGNHGQSMGWAARAHGVACSIVVPRGNSTEKNGAMRALGVNLIEHGSDFQEAREHAMHLAAERGAHMVPSYHKDLLRGVSTYWWAGQLHLKKFEGRGPKLVFTQAFFIASEPDADTSFLDTARPTHRPCTAP